ncbi:phosphoribosylformylglycinamidine synthase subunit PurS [bacterium]|nr:phosphoribosylformylglycinamidine synthase subunit PurS [bacterium]
MWKAKIVVTYKPGILDPEAKTIQHALGNLGYRHIQAVEAGRYFEVQFDKTLNKEDAESLTKEICDKILSNPVIQKYRYELKEVDE